jgi:hypothetical protein
VIGCLISTLCMVNTIALTASKTRLKAYSGSNQTSVSMRGTASPKAPVSLATVVCRFHHREPVLIDIIKTYFPLHSFSTSVVSFAMNSLAAFAS